MVKTEKQIVNGTFETLVQITEYITNEGWEFVLKSRGTDSSGVSLEMDLFDGKLILRSDGTWSLA